MRRRTMDKYTYYDIIIDPQDPRLVGAIGEEVYYGMNSRDIINDANKDYDCGILIEIKPDELFPFIVDSDSYKEGAFSLIILKKESMDGKKNEEIFYREYRKLFESEVRLANYGKALEVENARPSESEIRDLALTEIQFSRLARAWKCEDQVKAIKEKVANDLKEKKLTEMEIMGNEAFYNVKDLSDIIKRKMKVWDIANHYGKEAQLRQLIEECCELAVACNHALRNGKLENLKEEIADVELMTDQIKYLCGIYADVDNLQHQKLERQLKRIEDESNSNS